MPSTLMLENAGPGEARISEDGLRIYSAGSDGVLRIYDVLTGELISEVEIADSLGAMDLSPDGGTLVVVDGTEQTMYIVNLLQSNEVTAFDYGVNSPFGLITDLVVLPTNRVLYVQGEVGDGEGNGALGTVELNALIFNLLGSVVRGSVLSEGDFGIGALLTQPTGRVNVVSDLGANAEVELEGLDHTIQGLSFRYAAVSVPDSGISIFNVDQFAGNLLEPVIDLTDFNFGTVSELAFSENSELLYVLGQGGSTIFAVQTSDWSLAERFETGLQVSDISDNIVTLLVDPRGQFFTIEAGGALTVLENPSAPDIEGSEFPDQLAGTAFGDVISGFDGNDEILAGGGADFINGGTGIDRIDGGSNVDTVVVDGNFADYTITQIVTGRFEISDGQDPNQGGSLDDVTNVEFVQFDDQTLRLLRGEGVSVTFDTADTSAYQSAMNAVRDFDGNDLGGEGSWLRIGEADVNGDGDIDQIVVNREIGRFATIGTAPDGLVYFEDFSWSGETRVAGIYIDPFVANGSVEQGSEFDSQRRFQNDLEIENINRVLGADDYNGDGIQEVYFALTDGTAFLQALMHDDGNIRFANYQSEQQVRDYLTANGFDENTFGDWFGSSAGAEPASVPATKGAPEVIHRDFDPQLAWQPGEFPQFVEDVPVEFFG